MFSLEFSDFFRESLGRGEGERILFRDCELSIWFFGREEFRKSLVFEDLMIY